jgi:hypothetical protein
VVLATPPDEEPTMEKVTCERRKPVGKREDDLSNLPVDYGRVQARRRQANLRVLRRLVARVYHRGAHTPQVKVMRHVRQVCLQSLRRKRAANADRHRADAKAGVSQ